jgi:WD40 repeat protein
LEDEVMHVWRFVLWGVVALVLGTTHALAQADKKDSESGQRQFDANKLFDGLSDGKDVWVRPGDGPLRLVFDKTAEKMGITNGKITREQFNAYMKKEDNRSEPRSGNAGTSRNQDRREEKLPVPVTGKLSGVDIYGDPLPVGATARLGTIRWRHKGLSTVVFGPEGKTLITAGDDGTIRVWEVDSGKELRELDLRLEAAPNSGRRTSEFIGLSRERSLVISVDRKLLALRNIFGTVSIWDVNSGRPLHRLVAKKVTAGSEDGLALPRQGPRLPLAFSRDGRYLAAQGENQLYLYETASGKEVRQFGTSENGESMLLLEKPLAAFSADGKRLIWGQNRRTHSDGRPTVFVWEIDTGKQLVEFQPPPTFEELHALSPDGRIAVLGGSEAGIGLWDPAANKEVLHLAEGIPWNLSVVEFSPAGNMLALWDEKRIFLIDAVTGAQKHVLGDRLGEGTFWLPRRLLRFRGSPTLAFSPDGSRIAIGGDINALRVWDVATGKRLGPDFGHRAPIKAVAVSPSALMAVTLGTDDTVRQWDIATGKETRLQATPLSWVDATLSPDGRLAAFLVSYRLLHVVDVATGRDVLRLEDPERARTERLMTNLTLSGDGRTVVARSRSGAARFLDVATGKQRVRAENVGKVERRLSSFLALSPLAFSPDSRIAAVVDVEQKTGEAGGPGWRRLSEVLSTIRLLDLATGDVIRRFDSEAAPIELLAFSLDGRSLAAGNKDNTLFVWETVTGKKRLQITHNDSLRRQSWSALAFSPDSRLLATGGEDDTVRLWDANIGKEISRFAGHHGAVLSLAFAPGGERLVSASADSTGLVWQVPSRAVPTTTLDAAQMERLWDDLKAEDAAKAYQAICTLSADPTRSVLFLHKEVQPAPAPDAKRIAQLIADLDGNQFEVREKANQELEKLGKAAEPVLRQALTGDLSLEARRRVEHVLARPEAPLSTPEDIRLVRAIEVLGRIGSPEAKEVLRSLAKGAAGHWLTRDAASTLEWLDRAVPAKP